MKTTTTGVTVSLSISELDKLLTSLNIDQFTKDAIIDHIMSKDGFYDSLITSMARAICRVSSVEDRREKINAFELLHGEAVGRRLRAEVKRIWRK